MTLPNFLIVGAPRCGTTFLHAALSQHPDIFMSSPKEPAYFLSHIEPTYVHSPPVPCTEEAAYRRLFQSAEGKKIIGEASAYYLAFGEETIPRIRALLGDPKILICLRHPIERLLSHFHLPAFSKFRIGLEDLLFKRSLWSPWEKELEEHQLVYLSRYSDKIALFKQNFSTVKIILQEDLAQCTEKTIREILECLEVDESVQLPLDAPLHSSRTSRLGSFHRTIRALYTSRKNSFDRILGKERASAITTAARNAIYRRFEINSETRKKLCAVFSSEIDALELMLGRSLTEWRS